MAFEKQKGTPTSGYWLGSGLLTMMAAAQARTPCSLRNAPVSRHVHKAKCSAKQPSPTSSVATDAALLNEAFTAARVYDSRDLFDCGLTGEHVLYMLEEARRSQWIRRRAAGRISPWVRGDTTESTDSTCPR